MEEGGAQQVTRYVSFPETLLGWGPSSASFRLCVLWHVTHLVRHAPLFSPAGQGRRWYPPHRAEVETE